MIRVAIDCERLVKVTTREKVKEILENSETAYEDLKKSFPKGFKLFNREKRIIQFGDVPRYRVYIQINGFNPKTMEYSDEDAVLDVREETDY